jgi:phage shock protein C
MSAEYRKLYRSRSERMIAGVCGGLGEYFGIDPTLVRVLFIAATVLGFGAGPLIYLFMMIVVPSEPQSPTAVVETTEETE